MNPLAPRPPRWAERALERAVAGSPYADDIAGDLHESFAARAARSAMLARWWYCAEAIRLAARFALRRRPGRRRGRVQMDRLVMDLRYATRVLLKRPATTAAIVVTLALGLGANAAVFGLIDALVLRPYALPDTDRIVMPVDTTPNQIYRRGTVSPADFLDWRRETGAGAIATLTAYSEWSANLVGKDEPERVQGMLVSSEFFSVIGVQPALGRGFLREEETIGLDRRVVLSDGLWKRRFGGDPAVVGRSIIVDASKSTIVGVMPPGFDFPTGAELWAPLAFDARTAVNRGSRYLTVFGRLAAGRTLEQAQAELSVVADRIAREHPQTNRDHGIKVYSIEHGMRDLGLAPILSLWQAAALMVLLITCANIANLLLARGAERGREIAVRLALGSSRGRIVGQTLGESLVLAAAAIPLSLAVTWAGLRVIQASLPPRLVPYVAGWLRLGVDARAVAFTIALASIAAVGFGMLPAFHIARGRVADALKSDGRTGAGPGRERMRRALVAAELAIALPLLVAAMLGVTSVRRYLTGWQGYEPGGVLTARVALPQLRYATAATRWRFVNDALDALARVPGASRAAAGNIVPALNNNSSRRIDIAEQPQPDVQKRPVVDFRTVSDSYFDVLRIPILEGRGISPTDQPGTEPIAVVSGSMARKFWPGRSAIGGRVRIGDGAWMTVVGVCGDVIHDWFDSRNAPTFYRPLAQAPTDSLVFAVRTAGDPLALAHDVARAFAAVDPMQPIFDVRPMRQVLSENTIGIQFVAAVMGTFALLALVLAVLGLYAVMTYLVTLRSREIGVRMALGATPGDVTRLALRQGAQLTAVGVAIGLGLAIALGRGMEAGLLGIVSNDFRVTIALALLLAATAMGSSLLPARRAARVDPMIALRAE